uniref:EF-hand calcium binding domain 10 n=1 Tax=Suricata suricatta TaxID=37032 RepID=A0A673UDN1_SURSU
MGAGGGAERPTLPGRLATAGRRAMQAGPSREQEAKNYLEKHRIMELLNYLTSSLLFFRPEVFTIHKICETTGNTAWLYEEKPREYLISILERLRIAKITGVGFPFFMDNSNIVSMFEMLDTSNKGSISFVQYKEALKTLGLLTADEVLKDDGHAITLDKFRHEVNKRTEEIWTAF